MRSLKRPIAATGAAFLLVLSLAACGDDGDEKSGDDKSTESSESSDDPTSEATVATESSAGATDASTEEFCGGVEEIIEASDVSGDEPNESEWKEIQEAYADLGEIGPPDDIPAKEREGFDVVIKAIADLSYDEAEAAFGDEDGSDDIPGVSEEDNAKAEAFFAWAVTACPDLAGSESAESVTVPEGSMSVDPQE